MNTKAQATGFFFLFMVAIILFILAFSLAPVLTTNANAIRSNLDCSNNSISTDVKVLCGVIDISSPWLVGIILVMGGTFLGAKLLGIT